MAAFSNSTGQQTTTQHAEHMSHNTQLSRHLAAQWVFADMTRTLGVSFVPDLFAVLETKPAYLEAAWELFRDNIGLETLDGPTRRIVALAITTNEQGIYQIVALPHTFQLSSLGPLRSETILSMIHMFQAFDRYLSGLDRSQRLKPTTSGTTFESSPQAVRQPE